MYAVNANSVQEKVIHPGVSIKWLIKREDGAPSFEMRLLVLEKDCSTTGRPHPFEHEVFVTAGKGKIAGDGETIAVTAGDAILINPNEKHQIINSGDEPLEFICIIPNGKEDRIK